ncbi:MAG: hypothetical protein HFJ06_04430 [Lachnospiraceae bacterium]|nr:hypothetical protein [Lachnospiraceae bacterium]
MESIVRGVKSRIHFIKENFEVLDWVILGGLICICFLFYQHGDITHTGGSSFAYLNGHFLDFYEYNKKIFGVNNYLPTTYIIFAIWNIPLRLFQIVTEPTMDVCIFARMWYKLGTALFYAASAYLIYKICLYKKVSKKNSIWAAFLFMSNPIAIYSEFIFGQYDIFTVFFMLLGYYYYVQNKNVKFVLFFAIALTCKYFSLLIFVPLLLLREKNVWKIIKNMCGVVSVFIFETLIYIASTAFREGVFEFGATGYIFNLSWDNGFTKVSIVMAAWVLLCAWAYFKECRDETEEFQWGIYLSSIVMFICFGLSFWHPQWLLMAIPFWVLGMFFHQKPDIYMLLDLIMMVLFVALAVGIWQNECDQNLMAGGILKNYVSDYVGKNYKMADLLHLNDNNFIFSMLAAVMLVYVVFLHPSKLCSSENVTVSQHKGIMRLRYIGGVLFFVVPSFLCLYVNMH